MATENRKVSTRRLSNARRKRIQNRRMMIAISAVVVAFCIVIVVPQYNTVAQGTVRHVRVQVIIGTVRIIRNIDVRLANSIRPGGLVM